MSKNHEEDRSKYRIKWWLKPSQVNQVLIDMITETKDCKGIMEINIADLQRKSVISGRPLGTYNASSLEKLLNLASETGHDLHIVCE